MTLVIRNTRNLDENVVILLNSLGIYESGLVLYGPLVNCS